MAKRPQAQAELDVPPVPLTVMDNHDPALMSELVDAVRDVAASGAFTGGPFVERFEQAFADWNESPHSVGVSSGTEALTLTLRALDVNTGDEVLLPANSFIATAEAVVLAGATPRFADVDPDTQLITAATVERLQGPRVCGIIPVHLFGRTVEMDAIIGLARKWGAWVVEDCAQAHGSRYDGRRVGTWGDAGTFSFYPAKNLGAWGDGGAVVTTSTEIAERVRLLRSHGESPRYHHHVVGTTARLDALQAAVLERKLPRLDDSNMARRKVATSLREAIAGLDPVVAPVPAEAPCDHVYHQFVVRTRRREALQEHLAAQKIASAIHYPVPIHRSRAFADLSGGDDVAPTATRLASEICSLPIFPSMTERQIERIGDAVAEFSLTVADLAA